MNIMNYFRAQKRGSASVAKERLQIIVARERTGRSGPDYLPMLKDELLNVVRKYVEVDQDAVKIQLDREGSYDVLELNITLAPQHAAPASTQKRRG
jgi:cell division topological specificity factor